MQNATIAYHVAQRIIIRYVAPIAFRSKLKSLRKRADDRLREDGPMPAGRGILHKHISLGFTAEFTSLCLVPLQNIGGPMSDADCKRCIALAKRLGAWEVK